MATRCGCDNAYILRCCASARQQQGRGQAPAVDPTAEEQQPQQPQRQQQPTPMVLSGPMWTGPLHSQPFLEAMAAEAAVRGWTGLGLDPRSPHIVRRSKNNGQRPLEELLVGPLGWGGGGAVGCCCGVGVGMACDIGGCSRAVRVPYGPHTCQQAPASLVNGFQALLLPLQQPLVACAAQPVSPPTSSLPSHALVDTYQALLTEEADSRLHPWYTPIELLHQHLNCTPSRDALIAALRARGFAASRCHVENRALRSNASVAQMVAVAVEVLGHVRRAGGAAGAPAVFVGQQEVMEDLDGKAAGVKAEDVKAGIGAGTAAAGA